MLGKARVSLVTYDLEYYGKITNIVLGVLALTDIVAKHWALVIHFEDDDLVYLCEMTRDTSTGRNGEGDISWICERTHVEEIMVGKCGVDVYSFGTVLTSPVELKRLCSQNSCNGKIYNVFRMNCQSWALELLQYFGKSTLGFKKAIYAAASLITVF